MQEHPISKFKLLAAGTILSVAVLIEPPLSVLYLFYSISVLAFAIIRKKRSGFCERFAFFINLRCWFYISAAIFICAPVFIIFLAVKSGIGNIISAFPELLKDAEYDFSANGNVRNFLVSKIPRFAKIFGWHNLAAMILLCCAAIIYTKRKKTKHSFFMFFLSNFVLISCSAYLILSRLLFGKDGWADWMYYSAIPFPLFAFGFVNYLLCKKRIRG